MKKFYQDINNIRCEYLLKATPYSKENTVNFGEDLDKETFFSCLYSERDKRNGNIENDLFDNKVATAMQDLGNEFAKVSILHISGYAGCGKTTYLHHLLWKMRGDIGRYDVIDYEGSLRAIDPFVERTAFLLGEYYDLDIVCDFIDAIIEENLFVSVRFRNLFPFLREFRDMLKYCSKGQDSDKDSLYNLIYAFENHFKNQGVFLRFLFIIDFFLLLLDRFLKERNSPMVLVIDNSDSMSDLSEEQTLLPTMMDFSKDCNYFFVSNHKRNTVFLDKTVAQVCKSTKLQIIFTTRIATERRYETVYPDLETYTAWTSIKLPENYYNHKDVITKRINFYLSQEKVEGAVSKKLKQIKKLTNVAYHNSHFMKLFNGSMRVCVERLCSVIEDYPNEIVQEVINLYDQASGGSEAYEGAVGFFLALILDSFKHAGVYHSKLDLCPCRKDGTVTLSRIILTILREKGGRCSLLDMFQILTPLGFSSEEIATTIWNLCEEKREIWRRLLLFEMHVPTKAQKFINQATLFDHGNRDVEAYSELVMCTAGNAYLEFVLPHFEFMQSRHDMNGSIIDLKYQPLYADSSEELVKTKEGLQYRFELKIKRMFDDVSDCCYNSSFFAYRVMDYRGYSREEYLNQSFFNYHSIGWDGGPSPKQSYESRLIFRHITYIEKYRRFLLSKHFKDSKETKVDISKRLIGLIKNYLLLYQNRDIVFQTPYQDKAATELLEIIKNIEKSQYTDYTTKIETKG